jgi:hypothetical protein
MCIYGIFKGDLGFYYFQKMETTGSKENTSNSKHATTYDVLPSPKLSPRWALVSKTAKVWGLEGTLLALSTKRGRGAC